MGIFVSVSGTGLTSFEVIPALFFETHYIYSKTYVYEKGYLSIC